MILDVYADFNDYDKNWLNFKKKKKKIKYTQANTKKISKLFKQRIGLLNKWIYFLFRKLKLYLQKLFIYFLTSFILLFLLVTLEEF